MGNRAVCDALKALSYKRTANQGVLLHHLLLAAPDIDAGTFKEMASALCAMAGDITLYALAKDKAIALSQKLHKNPRAGAPPLLLIPGVTSIAEMQTDFLAHSYFWDSWPLLSDIHSIITADTPAPKRFGLRETVTPEGAYYVFRA